MKKKKKIISLVLIIAVCFAAECLISNYDSLGLIFSGAKKYYVNFYSDSFQCDAQVSDIVNSELNFKDGDIYVENLNFPLKNICIGLSGNYLKPVHLEVSYLDENFAYDDGYDYNNSYLMMYTGIDNYCNLSSFGNADCLKIHIGEDEGEVQISSIVLNSPHGFEFSLVRFIILVGILFIISEGIWKLNVEKADYYLLYFMIPIFCVIACSVTAFTSIYEHVDLLDSFPSQNYSDEDQYRQLFESFQNGKLSLDLDYDIDKLQALNSPYDRSERNAKETTGIFWDRAFYNGKFYSYFGAAPIFTVYYPVYILTHHVPTTLLVSTILCLYAIIFISLLYIEFIKHFCNDVPVVQAILGEVTVLFGSGIFAAAFEESFYYFAVLSGVAWTAAFFCFLLRAYFESSYSKRIVLLVVSGISAVLMTASRPTLIFYGAAALVPAIFILTGKEDSLKNKISYVVSIASPIAAGAVLIMVYNYKRFDNPFEFGFNYQLTVSKAKANTFSLSMISAALYHYFIQQPNINTKFPYIEIKHKALDWYGRYNYNGRTMGILTYPMTWGLFFAPLIYSKKNKFKTAFVLTFAVSAVIMAYIDMCKAGSHYRYTLDILMPVLLVSLTAVFDVQSSVKKISKKGYIFCYAAITAAMFLTIYTGYLMMFANEGRILMDTYTMIGYKLKSI